MDLNKNCIPSFTIFPEEGCFFVDFKGKCKAEPLNGGSSGDIHSIVLVFLLGGFFLSLLGRRRSWEKAAWGPEQQERHQLWVSLKLRKFIFPNAALVTSRSCPHLHLPITQQEKVLLGRTQPSFSSMFPSCEHITSSIQWTMYHSWNTPPKSRVFPLLTGIPSNIRPSLLGPLVHLPFLPSRFRRPPLFQPYFCLSPKTLVTFHSFRLLYVWEAAVRAKRHSNSGLLVCLLATCAPWANY